MDLVLWRHAEAEDALAHQSDVKRCLTSKGIKQAEKMAAWLKSYLPDAANILVSPALRTQQTAQALSRPFVLRDELLPDAHAQTILKLANWPNGEGTVLIVGHQPTLGEVAATILGMNESACPMRKGAVWWIRGRERGYGQQTILLTVQHPEML